MARETVLGRTGWAGPSLVALALLLLAAACGSGPATPTRDTPQPPLTSAPTTLAPTTTRAPYYDVVRGDTLESISAKLGVAVADLAAANGITDPDKIQAGQRLAVPQPPPAPAPTSTAAP
jgi:LysM repeat protein